MSGFENYREELASLDREIVHYAAVCGIAADDRAALDRCLSHPHGDWADDKAAQSLRGLLILRIRIETEMIGLGMEPPPIHLPA